jgi:hypothetical protein
MGEEVERRQDTGFGKAVGLWARPIRHELDVIAATKNTAISELTMPELIAWGTVIAYTAGTVAIAMAIVERTIARPVRVARPY